MSPTRRRGDALTTAIFQAVLSELAGSSFEELTFDKIASVAGTGKAALYRRWSTPAELVLAALSDPGTGFGEPTAPPGTGVLRDDLIALLEHFVRVLDEPRGRALLPLIAHRHRHPELFEQVHRLVVRPHQEVLLSVLRQAVERGEAAPGSLTPRVVSVGPRLILFQAWEGGLVDSGEIASIVDEVLIPLTRP
ncbi:TetR/AcrR family transcriptional regulator [Microbispora bryophytorum]|uniref:TetR family transcriptional regulator n=1 Tax=Microbispora bryophytorum TaxID=1460882 RepID=A0A8H9LJ88_9ACTN|nr:TetR/AcrR family transcriptional regulator [Microbispora bryophytorum]MBD3140297.1 TetR/AcrR family transcriptional regulator C-terminal ligand-binding domain-containing protein [Microbispora bryophytorum]TQS02015.1 TetR/AcrR family transcriptional regulator [Microbispora bryophytorum]GGO26601.1 TetR family transcriptional regulator [Microbispora bryophytorum]